MRRTRDWSESEFEHFVKTGARFWLLGVTHAQREDPTGFHASGLDSDALDRPVIVISHEGIGRFGVCLMTSQGDAAHSKIEVTEHSAYRKEDNGTHNEPLRLVSKEPNPKKFSYLNISKAYVVTLKMLEPPLTEPPMLDGRSFEVLQERTATLIEAFNGKIQREGMKEEVTILNDQKSRSRQINTIAIRGPHPRRGSLVKYGRNRDSGIQTLDSLRQPCSNGVFLIINRNPSVSSGTIWAYPVVLVERGSLASLRGSSHYLSHFILPICDHSDDLLPCKCIQGKSLRLVGNKILDESYLHSAFHQPGDNTASPTTTDECLCVRLTHRVALDTRLVSEVEDSKRLDDKSMALVEAAEKLRDKFSSCTPDKLPCMPEAKEQKNLAKDVPTYLLEDRDFMLAVLKKFPAIERGEKDAFERMLCY